MTSKTALSAHLYKEAIALAGLFQAAGLVERIATKGEYAEDSFQASINSVLKLGPHSVEEVYDGQVNFIPGLEFGFAQLEAVLQQQSAVQPAVIRYVMGLLHLQKRLSNNSELVSIVRTRVEQLGDAASYLDSENLLFEKLAGIYEDTLSTFSYRIQVQGNRLYLENQENVQRIRALLLAGIRAAMLWRQVGGKRWHLFLYRRKLLEMVRTLT